MGERIVVEGETAWRIVRAKQLGFLVDADAYFRAFAKAAVDADQWIGVLGWDIDSREDLGRSGWPHGDLPQTLAAFFDALVQRRERLHIDLLVWESAAIYALEREFFPHVKLGWATHSHVRFELDGLHAPGASHHQKVAVVDDTFAFTGGIDLTGHRWDTPEHLPDDPRRKNAWGIEYAPFHDLQVGLSGEAARVLGELARERWRRATGERIPAPEPRPSRPPPFDVDLEDADVGIVLTDLRDGERPALRQTEALHLRAIAAARDHIYLENQYLTSSVIGHALKESLARPRGPEIVVVVPRRCAGWLERNTMGILRKQLLKELYAADRHHRLRVFYPVADGAEVFVHAKTFVVDGRLMYLGSANLSDRSMGLDTECGVALEADGAPAVSEAIQGFHTRLLGEHLGASPLEVQATLDDTGSLLETIARLNGGARSLLPLGPDEDVTHAEWLGRILADRPLADPHEPIEAEHVFARLLRSGGGWDLVELPPRDKGTTMSVEDGELRAPTLPEPTEHQPEEVAPPSPELPNAVELRRWRRRAGVRAAVFLGIIAVVVAAWAFSPLGQLIAPRELSGWLAEWRTSPAALPVVVGLFVLAGLFVVPLNPVLVSTVIAFGPLRGALYGLLGALASAVTSYFIGRRLGRGTVARLTGERVHRVARRIAQRGFFAVVAARMVPVAPFPVINMVAGAVGIRLKHFFFGTALGMLPGLVVTASLGETLWALVQDPRPLTVIGGIVVAAAAFTALAMFRRRLLVRIGMEDVVTRGDRA